MTWTTRPRSDGPGGLAYHAAGPEGGAPVLLIHGVGLRLESWGALIPELTTMFAVRAVDLPGHGESAPLAITRPTIADYADHLAALIETGATPVALVGHSVGALIAVELAARYPDHVSAVAAVCAIHGRDAAAAEAVRIRAARLAEGHADPAPTLARWFGAAPDAPDIVAARDACDGWLRSCDLAGYAAAYQAFAASDGPSAATLAAVRCPALFLTGEHDPNSTPAMSRRLAATVSDGRAAVVPGAAHMVPMTHGEAVAHHLVPFLAHEGARHVTA